jgi:hypothetical protein
MFSTHEVIWDIYLKSTLFKSIDFVYFAACFYFTEIKIKILNDVM